MLSPPPFFASDQALALPRLRCLSFVLVSCCPAPHLPVSARHDLVLESKKTHRSAPKTGRGKIIDPNVVHPLLGSLLFLND